MDLQKMKVEDFDLPGSNILFINRSLFILQDIVVKDQEITQPW